MDSNYASRFYQPGKGTTCYSAASPDPQARRELIQAAAAEARRHDWQTVYSNSLALRKTTTREFFSVHAEKVTAEAQRMAGARAACARENPGLWPGPVGPDGDGDSVIVVILDLSDGLREPVRRLAEEGRSNAVALVLVTAQPYPWPFPCESLNAGSRL